MSATLQKLEDWTKEDTRRAKEIWARYQHEHDLSERKGEAAGIDPRTGEVWLGKSARDIVQHRQAQGLTSPLFFERIGYATYARR